MKANSKIETLDDVTKYLNDIPFINSGGCGVSALAIARWLHKNNVRLNIQFIMGYDGPDGFVRNSQQVFNNAVPDKSKINRDQEPVAPSHCGVIFNLMDGRGTQMVDCEKRFDILHYNYSHSFYDESILLKSVNNIITWNDCFSRKYVKKIAKTLQINLSDIDCQSRKQFLAKLDSK